MDKCPVCGAPLKIAKHEYRYKRDWLPLIKTKRLQRTVFVCLNDNYKSEPRDEDDYIDGKAVKVQRFYPVPCPLYAGTDMNNPKAIAYTSDWIEVE